MRQKRLVIAIIIIGILLLFLLLRANYMNSWRDSRFSNQNLNENNKVQDTSQNSAQDSSNPFRNSANWEAFDAGNINRLQTKGYFGAVFDGRYIYFAPCRTMNFHGIALRYDTLQDFKSKSSWESYDAGSTDGLDTKGYAGAVFDGRYVYYVPFAVSSTRHARVLRYDTKSDFISASGWDAFDAQKVGGSSAIGYDGAVFDGRYIYFAPFGYEPYAHAIALRYDIKSDFKSISSWESYDAKYTSNLNTKGYYGSVFDGRYVYYAPFNDGSGFHGRVLRYDTQSDFKSAENWQAYDAGNTDGLNTVGYKGAVFDGKYIYFVPFRDDSISHGIVLRYNTMADFNDESSWDAFNAGNIDGLETKGYVGAEFDGRYIYFVPYSYLESEFHAKMLRYDTKGDFKSKNSWIAYDAGSTDGLNTKGYKYSTSDGEYIYFTPYNNGKTFSGIALRYKIS